MPGKHVRFAEGTLAYPPTPSPTFSSSSLPSTSGPFTPPPINHYGSPYATTDLPPVHTVIHPALATSNPIQSDMSLPSENVALLYPKLLLQSATKEPLSILIIQFGQWRIPITPRPGSGVAFITVADVLAGLYSYFRINASTQEYSALAPKQQQVVNDAYVARYRRCPGEQGRLEKAKGVKKIDFLGGHSMFKGLSPSKAPGVWELHVSHS